jgi:hypothetical protein
MHYWFKIASLAFLRWWFMALNESGNGELFFQTGSFALSKQSSNDK